MNITYQRNRALRSPFQPHPAKRIREGADTQDAENPIRQILQRLCQTQYNLCATFSPDTGTMSELKTPGLVAVKCVLSKDGKPVGIGRGSTVISKLNKGLERALFGCLNGALMSATNSACKTLDVERLKFADKLASSSAMLGDAYRAKEEDASAPASPRQLEYLKHLLQVNADDEVRNQWEPNLDTLTRAEASELISRYAAK